MSDLRNDQISLFDSFDVLEQAAEQTVVKNYARSLVNIKSYLSSLFERYENDGKLFYDDMALYGRLEKMSRELRGLMVSLYAANTKIITGALTSTYTEAFTGQGEAIKRAWGSKSLIGIIREEELHRALTNEISGLAWAERMGLRREQAVAKVRETIVQGLQNGETYKQMAERLNEAMGKDVPNAIRIVRNESGRVFAEARKDRLDRIQGIDMTKEWYTAKDEGVRVNHRPMHGVKIPYRQNFVLPNGNEGFGPMMFGDPKDDIGCRCFYVVDDADEADTKTYTQGLDFGEDGGIIGSEGEVMNFTGASGAIPRHDIERMDKHAEQYYEQIRRRSSDVEAIARNTGFSEDDIAKIKSHLFLNEYDLGDATPSKFDPLYDIAISWQRLIDGKNIQEMDLVLLRHELMEHELMNVRGMSYIKAHRLTEASHNYSKFVRELDEREGIR